MPLTKFRNSFEQYLGACVALGGSDIHFSAGGPVRFRIDGRLQPQGEEILSSVTLSSMAESILSGKQYQEFLDQLTVDMGYSSAAGERFRVNCYREMGKTALAVRHLNQQMMSLKDLDLPTSLRELAMLKSGLVLITGATGSGKSSTLAVLLNEINQTRDCHILTVEDPVEFVHASKKSLVHHREVHTDVPTYADAVRAAMREDPDVLMVGEMRDLETMQASITAAETGHLVFSTLHTGEAIGAVERFIGHFPGAEQATARHRLSMVLQAVIAQRLVPRVDDKGRIPVVELLRVNTAVANLIQSSKSMQIYSMMESGARDGMWTLDQDLARLVKSGKIGRDVAMELCSDQQGFDRHVNAARVDGRS